MTFAAIRSLIGVLRAASFADVAARTYVLERTQPLSQADRDYCREAVFEGPWCERLRPYLDSEQWDRPRIGSTHQGGEK